MFHNGCLSDCLCLSLLSPSPSSPSSSSPFSLLCFFCKIVEHLQYFWVYTDRFLCFCLWDRLLFSWDRVSSVLCRDFARLKIEKCLCWPETCSKCLMWRWFLDFSVLRLWHFVKAQSSSAFCSVLPHGGEPLCLLLLEVCVIPFCLTLTSWNM